MKYLLVFQMVLGLGKIVVGLTVGRDRMLYHVGTGAVIFLLGLFLWSAR